MKRTMYYGDFLLAIGVIVLSACGMPAPVIPATGASTSGHIEIPTLTIAPIATYTPVVLSPTSTISPAVLERPVFLAWPLPPTIGIARISQYPNTPWTWNYLGLNAGKQCPPMFGYLLDLSSLPYWRDTSTPEEQDKAQADPHNFEMVECYATEGAVGANGHEGTDIKAPAGTPVYASAGGKVQEWRSSGLNSMIVLKHCLGGNWDANHQCAGGRQWYTTYMHIVLDDGLLQENADVAPGAQLGAVYDQTINSHLHFEVGLDRRSYTNYVNPWGQDGPPWLECMWLDQSLCATPEPAYQRVAVYTAAEKLLIVQGDADPVEVRAAQGIKQFRLWGERVSVIDPENYLRVWEGQYAGGSLFDDLMRWRAVAANVLDHQITDRRVAILDGKGNFWVKENGLDGEWLLQSEDMSAFSISDYRIGYLAGNGDLLVKEGSLESAWVGVAQNVMAFQLIDNRIAYVDGQGDLYVNEGDILAEFQQMASGVRAFQVENARLGAIDAENRLLVKEGNLRANWAIQAEHVASFQLADNRVLMLGEDGVFKLKEGSLYQEWGGLPVADAKGAFMNGGMPVYVR